jgi:prefoldin subunit 5
MNPEKKETQLDRIEEILRTITRQVADIRQQLSRINHRLDAVCGHESQQT